jgi:hypothetical protein
MSWSWAWWIFVPVLICCVILNNVLNREFSHASPRIGDAEREADRAAAFVSAIINGALWAAILTAALGFLV